MNTTEGCFCKEGHHTDGNDGWGAPSKPTLWAADGIPFCAHGWGGASTVWAIADCANVDLAQAVADYYLLDAVKADMLVPRPYVKPRDVSFEVRLHHDTKWRECCDTTEDVPHKSFCKPGDRKPSTTQAAAAVTPFDEARVRAIMQGIQTLGEVPATMPVVRARAFLRHAKHTAIMAQVFRNYAHYAIAGELTHHNSDEMKASFGGTHAERRAGWFKFVQHVGGAAAAKYAERMFLDGRWATAYGGEPWAQIARTLWEFESGHWDAWLFVDRMFSLQHNTGSALNKVEWKQPTGHNYGANSLQVADGPLDCHANSKFDRLGAFASEDVRKLVTDYWVLANNEQIARGIDVTPMPEFTLEEAKPVYSYTAENSGCDCDMCQPHKWCANGCGAKLNNKEIGHIDYAGMCEACAKPNNCNACGKAIIAKKVQCDTCKKNGAKAKKTPKVPPTTDPVNVVGYSLTPPTKQPITTPKPGGSPAAKLKAIQAAQAAQNAKKAANVVDDGEWDDDDDIF